jgi:hypothetical protein
MSGAFKWASVSFDPTAVSMDITTGLMVVAAVAAARATAAVAEAACRAEAEATALGEAVAASKLECAASTDALRKMLSERSSQVSAADMQRAIGLVAQAEIAIRSARTFAELHNAVIAADRVKSDFDRAAKRKMLDDARRGNTGDIEFWRVQFESLRAQVAEMSDTAEAAADLEGAIAVKALLAAAGGTLQTTNEKMIAAKIGELDAAVQKHSDAIAGEIARKRRAAAISEQAAAESKAIVLGLKADEVVMRWHAAAVDALAAELSAATETDGERGLQVVQAARERAASIVKEANAAQLKADQRDYIANCMSKTLEEMGFVVGPLQAEHPEHPATATVIHAATASGKNIAISVPVDGQVWYNVRGFPKSTESKVGGGEAAICDEAEEVISEMHEALMSEFHVQMGELMWDGKDPARRLRAVKSLPSSQSSDRSLTGGKH